MNLYDIFRELDIEFEEIEHEPVFTVEQAKAIENKIMENKFTKEQLVNSQKYRQYKDLLQAILKKDKLYTLKQIDDEIKKFMKGKV